VSPLTIIIIAFLIALPVMAFAFSGGAVIVALPVSVIGIALIGFLDFTRRRRQSQTLKDFRDQAKTEKVEFTERDRETLAPE
jgi:UDP-N-acetylmuramyl pentapeptide phosphotransferase/UDP-N-acetylglucosamine-1-phosphate transferase